MLPSNALKDRFSEDARSRGDAYAGAQAVDIVSRSDRKLVARVRGTDVYSVTLTRTAESGRAHFDVSCTCPAAASRADPCKHIWATIVAGERERLGPLFDGDDAPGDHVSLTLVEPLHGDVERTSRVVPSGHLEQPRAAGTTASRFLSTVEQQLLQREVPTEAPFAYADAALLYVVDAPASAAQGITVLNVMYQRRSRAGRVGTPKIARFSTDDIAIAPAMDRRILALVSGAKRATGHDYGYGLGYGYSRLDTRNSAPPATFLLPAPLAIEVLPMIARNARAWIKPSVDGAIVPLAWDDGPAWRFSMTLAETETGYRVDGELVRAGVRVSLSEPHLVLAGAMAVVRGALGRYEGSASDIFRAQLERTGPLEISADEKSVLARLIARSGAPAETVPEALRFTDVRTPPTVCLSVDQGVSDLRPWLPATLSFDYDGSIVSDTPGEATAIDSQRQRVIHRDTAAETAAAIRVTELDARPAWHEGARVFEIAARQFTETVRILIADGWRVEADGRRYRASTAVRLAVTSGIDWFDLHGIVEFGDQRVPLSAALAALTSNRPTVRLDDGTIGVLPEDWLARYAPIAAAGDADDDRIRFSRQQATILDALLAGREREATIEVDETFAQVRRELASFDRVEPLAEPATFEGRLRPYQREGLGWFAFLRQFGFGGCLADDMGLGKTIMVLALLEQQRLDATTDSGSSLPSLVVVPRSLVGNWMAEAARFTPRLRVLDYSHAARATDAADAMAAHDVALVTYGTMRRDIETLSAIAFEYVILDEAQAIKNAGTAAAKAARLLRARHRLALSGTPIENHLGELWSLFEFLNPGVLGRSSVFERATSAVSAGTDPEMMQVLSRGLRPFILRRTKQQVARDLPARTEQTIACELSTRERTAYEALRRHYRDTVIERIERDGLAKSKMHVLEALLRLRQASCHLGLIDPARRVDSSAKFDLLIPRLQEVIEEGHKALVFSQFTTLLGLLRARLDEAGVAYEYLDGHTRDRAGRVQRFQEDPGVGLFLISLKAGGIGLNLTAAEYVFLLDPWWNPAVEAQAIDRAHRIGQTREVFAYRLIAKDTIEEKVLQLQHSKRALADAVLSADAVGLRQMGRDDLELLLS